ncbi:MAG: bacillithiol biosynthesis cysteine-adding enzyme BshC [Firmicutes bacterium]|nr:bacillithiol biosynthesis cysteine-adding enzyme BshC [Bacillota bacterium]
MGCRWRYHPTVRDEGSLAGALIDDFSRVAGLYPAHPFAPEGYASRARWLAEGWTEAHGGAAAALEHRAALARALVTYQERVGNSPRACARAAELRNPDAVVVVTGQQAGLFTGPAYTAYKAVTALRLAERLEAELGRPVVPVFWIAGEDHDYDEAASVSGFDAAGRRLPFRLPPAPALRSVGTLPVPPAARRLAQELVEGAAPTASPGRAWLEDAILRTLERSQTLGEWFARQLASLFEDDGLVLLDPMSPEIRRLSAAPLAALMARADDVVDALAEGERRVRAAGFAPQMPIDRRSLCLFRYVQGRRLALVREGALAATRHGEWSVERARLPEAIVAEPEMFSPAAPLRPLVQDWLLPTVVQVGGPGELAYLPEVLPAYAVAGWQAPVWTPRLSATVVWPEWAEDAARWGVSVETFFDEPAWRARLQERLAAADGADVDVLFAEARGAVEAAYERLIGELRARVSPHLEPIGRANLERVRRQLDYFAAKARQHQRRAHRDEWRRWQRLRDALRPQGRPQERDYCVFALFGRFGRDAWREFATTAPMPPAASVAVAEAEAGAGHGAREAAGAGPG